ncbi:hypothetical protein F9288_05960 [Sphingomonas sp. CL5.1]|uniref:hypothetical protein n=1 Tax=Sphingomonas sp. CL5.1 TaxID=2653203 RepID=UPI001584343E|nr:hypothetical protein [Sphingomonas sp. CL5.1]QKR99246.1 hypothetical protein F9288_05960 [Sphingomonas sp. CL5.1]
MRDAANDNSMIEADLAEWFDHFGGLTLGELTERLEECGYHAGAIQTVIHAALMRLDIFVSVPLGHLDLDDSINRLDLIVGVTRVEVLTTRYHKPHFVAPAADGGRLAIWDLYVEDTNGIHTDIDPELARLSYAERQRRNPRTPVDCVIPFVAVLPGEAIQLTARFGADGVLAERSIWVGPRLS